MSQGGPGRPYRWSSYQIYQLGIWNAGTSQVRRPSIKCAAVTVAVAVAVMSHPLPINNPVRHNYPIITRELQGLWHALPVARTCARLKFGRSFPPYRIG